MGRIAEYLYLGEGVRLDHDGNDFMIVALIWNFNLRVRYHQIVDQKLQKLNIYGKIVWINFSQKSLQNQNFKMENMYS